MKLIAIASPLIILCAAAFAQAAPQSQNDSLAQDLIGKSKSIEQALKSKDVQVVRNLLSSDFRMIGSDGKISGKGELLGEAQEGVLHDFMFYNPQVTPMDSDSALVTYDLIVSMPEGDDGIAPRYQKISDLWVHQGGDWKLKFEQATPLRPID